MWRIQEGRVRNVKDTGRESEKNGGYRKGDGGSGGDRKGE